MITRGAWTELGDGIRVRQSRAFRMNSTVLRGTDHALVVDPGILPSELDDIAASLEDVAPRSITLLFTHGHWDHVVGRPWWPEARSGGHDRLAAELRRDAAEIQQKADDLAAGHGEKFARRFAPFRPDLEVSGLHYRRLGDFRLVFRDAFGHSDSQLSIHLPERGLLIAADMLSDIEIPLLDRPPAEYRRTLETLMPLVEGGAIEKIVPGHGSIAEGRDEVAGRFERDLAYLKRLEREVARAHASGVAAAQAGGAVGAWDDIERDPAFPMREQHLENIAISFAAAR